jgi:predicted HAD superfamily hydrolase
MENEWRKNVVITVLHIILFTVSVDICKIWLSRSFRMTWIVGRDLYILSKMYNREFYENELKVYRLWHRNVIREKAAKHEIDSYKVLIEFTV